MVSNLLTIEGLPVALKERILKQAEGNPFYLEELLRSLMDAGAIAQDEATGRWQATGDVAEIALPDTLQGVLLARIDRLQEDTKRVLQMASVIGRTFLYLIDTDIEASQRPRARNHFSHRTKIGLIPCRNHNPSRSPVENICAHEAHVGLIQEADPTRVLKHGNAVFFDRHRFSCQRRLADV